MDTVIIGAGVGGLAAAIALAARGVHVTVLESQAGAGGKMRPAMLDNMQFDSGPTVLTMRWVFEELFALAGADLASHLNLKRLPVRARHYWSGGATLDLAADHETTVDAIGHFAGKSEAQGYRAFAGEARRIHQSLLQPFLRSQRTKPWGLAASMSFGDVMGINPFESLWHALGRHFKNARLRQLFGRYATYCGTSPFKAPATLMLVSDVEAEGVWRAEGGMSALAAALEALARRLGVTFHFGCRALGIETSLSKVVAVTDDNGVRHACTSVVVNADSAAVAAGLFGRSVSKTVVAPATRDRSLSAITWCTAAPATGVGLDQHNVFFSDNYEREFSELARGPAADPTVYVCDQNDGRKLLLINAPAHGADAPEDAEERLTRRLERCGLSLSLQGLPVLRRAPKDFADLYPGTAGALLREGRERMDVDFSQAAGPHEDSGALPRRREHASGSGRADGSAVGPEGGGGRVARPRFDAPVAPGGYRWWYVDATSDDGAHGLTIIGFVGSVFSPYYARARKTGRPSPANHCAINVALYGRPRRWAMTERGAARISRAPDRLAIGRSAMTWRDGTLVIDINERCAPLPYALKGRVTLSPGAVYDAPVPLDSAGRHHWQAVAPHARVSVAFETPRLRWEGGAYHDMNWGEEALEHGFKRWSWLRTNAGQSTRVLYDIVRHDGSRYSFGRLFDGGHVTSIAVPPVHALRTGKWGMTRDVASESPPRLISVLEDAPFYTRNHVGITLEGHPYEAYHESLSLERFTHPVVQLMLPFRMPRLA